jgi:hypothetical protein
MQVICTRCAQFFNSANQIEAINKAGEKIMQTDHSLHNAITVTPSNSPQIVPDWIEKDPLFDLLLADGHLIVVQVMKTAADAPKLPAPSPSSGWGAQPEGAGLGFQTSNKTE